jgi:type VI protein secretion system component VasK
VWWTLLVGLLGLAAWFFAATVTFGANFPPALQLALGYVGGGLPFALVAALLQRSWPARRADPREPDRGGPRCGEPERPGVTACRRADSDLLG